MLPRLYSLSSFSRVIRTLSRHPVAGGGEAPTTSGLLMAAGRGVGEPTTSGAATPAAPSAGMSSLSRSCLALPQGLIVLGDQRRLPPSLPLLQQQQRALGGARAQRPAHDVGCRSRWLSTQQKKRERGAYRAHDAGSADADSVTYEYRWVLTTEGKRMLTRRPISTDGCPAGPWSVWKSSEDVDLPESPAAAASSTSQSNEGRRRPRR